MKRDKTGMTKEWREAKSNYKGRRRDRHGRWTGGGGNVRRQEKNKDNRQPKKWVPVFYLPHPHYQLGLKPGALHLQCSEWKILMMQLQDITAGRAKRSYLKTKIKRLAEDKAAEELRREKARWWWNNFLPARCNLRFLEQPALHNMNQMARISEILNITPLILFWRKNSLYTQLKDFKGIFTLWKIDYSNSKMLKWVSVHCASVWGENVGTKHDILCI